MQQTPPRSARELSSPVRSALEQMLGRPLLDNESVSVRAYQPHESPSQEEQRAIAEELRKYFARIDDKTRDISRFGARGNPRRGYSQRQTSIPSYSVRITLDSTILVRAHDRAR